MCGDNNCTDTSLIVIPPGQDGVNGTNGTNGTDGAPGIDGIFGGYSAKWKFDATTGVGAASTYLKFNSTILSTVDSIEVNETNAASINHAAFLSSFINEVDGVSYWGLVRIWKEFDSNTFWLGKVVDTSDLGAARSFAVEHILSNGTFTADDDVILNFTPNGAVGNFPGTNVVYSEHAVTQTNLPGETNLLTYTVVANTLKDEGDQLEVQAVFTRSGLIKSDTNAFIKINGTNITYLNDAISMGVGMLELVVHYTVTRKSADQVYVNMRSHYITGMGGIVPAGGSTKTLNFANANTHTLEFSGSTISGSNTIYLREVVIKKFEA